MRSLKKKPIYFYVYECLHAPCERSAHSDQKRVSDFPGTEISDAYELPCAGDHFAIYFVK